jgi:hypothetical protein
MSAIKRSPAAQANPHLKEAEAEAGEGNGAWLKRHGDSDGIILLGGASLAGFRLRVAQSSLRQDMLPSMWSLCGVLLEDGVFASVPLDIADVSAVPQCNGIRRCPIAEYDSPDLYPNIAVIRFAKQHPRCHDDITRVQNDRSIINIPALMLPWLGFIWGAAGGANPLQQGNGIPSAAFVETVFAMSGFELTPGLSSASSCPEAIWQSAKWWTGYYEDVAQDASSGGSDTEPAAGQPETSVPIVPTGFFAIRQAAATALS